MRFVTLALMLIPSLAFAQAAAPPPAPVSCEQQLDAAQQQNIQLRKSLAQAEFRSATIEEQALTMQKQLSADKAKAPKAAQAPASTVPTK